jgi:hypothetical protein
LRFVEKGFCLGGGKIGLPQIESTVQRNLRQDKKKTCLQQNDGEEKGGGVL